MPTHWILRIGDGANFVSSSKEHIWGIRTDIACGKYFMKHVQKDDLLWFMKSKTHGHILAVATFKECKERNIGPLLSFSKTNEELGWTGPEDRWDMEVHYTDLYNISTIDLKIDIRCISSVLKYRNDTEPLDPIYANIVKYSTITRTIVPPKKIPFMTTSEKFFYHMQ
jgi:hypothetical protein